MKKAPSRQAGMSLVELMIALTLGLMIVSGVATVFVANSKTRQELEKTSRQIENGRYAMQLIDEDLQLAGFLGSYVPPQQVPPAYDTNTAATPLTALPDPCEASNLVVLDGARTVHVQGYDQGASAPTCLSDIKTGTDILVVRHASACLVGETGCDSFTANALHLQVSGCEGDTQQYMIGIGATAAAASTASNGAANGTAGFTLRKVVQNTSGCTAQGTGEIRRLRTHIYYVANNNNGSDGVPTLKRWELGSTTNPVALVEGIENLQLEYGIDTNGDGTPDVYVTNPSTYDAGGGTCVGAACVRNWWNVMAVKVFLLARNTERTPGYADTKQYTLGTTATAWAPSSAEQAYKRHLYTATIRLTNPAGRRQS